jgi:uncharacterized repeat protein (TIGR01451 family)
MEDWWAYVGPGESLDASFTRVNRGAGGQQSTYTVVDATGLQLWTCTITAANPNGTVCAATGLTGAPGAWRIRQSVVPPGTPGGDSSAAWNITVRSAGGAALSGRVWATRYDIFQANAGANTTNLQYWMVNDTGYRYNIQLDNYFGIYSPIVASASGNLTGDGSCTPLYQSVTTSGGVVPPQCGLFRTFFDPPAPDLPASAPSVDGTLQIVPPLLNLADVVSTDLAFAPTAPVSRAGRFTYSFTSRFVGGYELQIDANGNGSYTDPVDRTVPLGANGSGNYGYDFDGLNGLGAPIDQCTAVNAQLHFDRIGEIHVVNADVEGRAGGIQVTRLNGAGAPDQTIYWDDSRLPAAAKTSTTPVIGATGGTSSAGGAHGWPNTGANPWGNDAATDDWAYVTGNQVTGQLAIPGQCLDVDKSSSLTADSRPGDVITYTVKATNTGASPYTAADPAILLDDLSGVLDDATYDIGSGAADLPGTVSYVEPLLGWTGALAAGATVTITYTVTLKDGGDSTLRNVAWDGNITTSTPACDPPDADGRDGATGAACAENVELLPRVRVVKTSNPSAGTGVGAGDVITYTLTYSNTGDTSGPVDSTDDLTGVLDDAAFVPGSLVSSLPGVIVATLTRNTLAVAGDLPAATTATVSYQVQVREDGARTNNLLENLVAGDPGNEDICALPADCLTTHGIGELAFSKRSDPASGTTVAPGGQLTYTLRFENTGESDVSVGHVDNLAGLLDDATLTTAATASDPSLTVAGPAGNAYVITGTLAPRAVVTISYTVTVNPDGQRGDDVLADFLFPSGKPKTECVTGDTDCTVNYVSVIVASKSADPADGTAVHEGQKVTYILTFTNTSANPAAGQATVAYTDYLVDVLDDATLADGPTAGIGLSAQIAGDQILITGSLGSGQSATVAYSVTVKNYAQQHDHLLGNVLAVTGGDPICVPGNGLCTDHDTLNSPPGLAQTGLDVTAGAVSVLALVLGGGAFVHVARRRRAFPSGHASGARTK